MAKFGTVFAVLLVVTVSCAASSDFCASVADANWVSQCGSCNGDLSCTSCLASLFNLLGAAGLNAASRCAPGQPAAADCIARVALHAVSGSIQNVANYLDRCFVNNCGGNDDCVTCLTAATDVGDLRAADQCVASINAASPTQCVYLFDVLSKLNGAADIGNRAGFLGSCLACGGNNGVCSVCVPLAYKLQDYGLLARCGFLGSATCGVACQNCFISALLTGTTDGTTPATPALVAKCIHA